MGCFCLLIAAMMMAKMSSRNVREGDYVIGKHFAMRCNPTAFHPNLRSGRQLISRNDFLVVSWIVLIDSIAVVFRSGVTR